MYKKFFDQGTWTRNTDCNWPFKLEASTKELPGINRNTCKKCNIFVGFCLLSFSDVNLTENSQWSHVTDLMLLSIQGVSKLLGETSGVSFLHQKIRKKLISIYVHENFIFRGSPLVHPNSVIWNFVCGDTKTLVHSAPIENVQTLHQYICVPDKPPRHLWKGATVHDQTCLHVHWFRLRTFWTFVVNCGLIKRTKQLLSWERVL